MSDNRDYTLFTDSSCDLPAELADKLEIKVLSLTVRIDGKEYINYLDGREIAFEKFYQELRDGKTASTAAVSVGVFEDAFEKELAEGRDILYLGFSSALSTTVNSGKIAAASLSAKYPERKIYVVDTLSASLGQGLLLYYAASKRLDGMGIEELRDWAEAEKLHFAHWFTVDNLMHLMRGGRVSATSAIAGTLIGIKPVMHTDNEGRLTKVSVARGRKASLAALVKQMERSGAELNGSTTAICHSDCLAEANAIADIMKKQFGVREVIVNWIGPVIGAHTGPGTIGIFFTAAER